MGNVDKEDKQNDNVNNTTNNTQVSDNKEPKYENSNLNQILDVNYINDSKNKNKINVDSKGNNENTCKVSEKKSEVLYKHTSHEEVKDFDFSPLQNLLTIKPTLHKTSELNFETKENRKKQLNLDLCESIGPNTSSQNDNIFQSQAYKSSAKKPGNKYKKIEDKICDIVNLNIRNELFKSVSLIIQEDNNSLSNINQSSNLAQSSPIKMIFCNNCKSNQIMGIGYKCAFCPNYYLCSKCFLLDVHSYHVLLSITEKENGEIQNIIQQNQNKDPGFQFLVKKNICLVSLIEETPKGNFEVRKGEMFSKKWKIRNEGISPWPDSTTLNKYDGEGFPLIVKKTIGKVYSGSEYIILIDFVAPIIECQVKERYRLFDGIQYFGNILSCEYSVQKSLIAKAIEKDSIDLEFDTLLQKINVHEKYIDNARILYRKWHKRFDLQFIIVALEVNNNDIDLLLNQKID